MTTSEQSVFVEKGVYAINEKHLSITDPSDENLFLYKYDAGAHFNSARKLQNNVLCGFVALTENPNSPGDMMLAPNATLVNKGIIDLHFKDLYEQHKKMLESGDENYYVDALRLYAMAAGENSMIINEGVINMYLDHDADADTTMYCCAMWAEANSQLINRGEIHFYGNGSWQSLIRGVGGVANHLQVINEGFITVDVDRCFQTRILHSAGMFGSLWNKKEGRIQIKVRGRIMTMGSVTGTHMTNDGEIDVTSIATLIEGKIPYLFNFPPMATGMYEHFRPGTLLPAPIVNRGSIKVHLVGSEASGPDAIAFGFYYQMENKDEGETPVRYVSNEGTVEVTQEGPQKYITADMGVNMQNKNDNPVKLKVVAWNTRERDFNQAPYVFACHSIQLDLSDARITVDGKPTDIDPTALVHQTEDAKEAGHSCIVIK